VGAWPGLPGPITLAGNLGPSRARHNELAPRWGPDGDHTSHFWSALPHVVHCVERSPTSHEQQ